MITVTNGEVTSAIDEDGNAAEVSETVESVFNLIRSEIDAEVSTLNADFDPETGYPTRVSVNPSTLVTGFSYFVTLSDLEIL